MQQPMPVVNFGMVLIMIGLPLVIAARSCDNVGARGVSRAQARAAVAEQGAGARKLEREAREARYHNQMGSSSSSRMAEGIWESVRPFNSYAYIVTSARDTCVEVPTGARQSGAAHSPGQALAGPKAASPAKSIYCRRLTG